MLSLGMKDCRTQVISHAPTPDYPQHYYCLLFLLQVKHQAGSCPVVLIVVQNIQEDIETFYKILQSYIKVCT